MYWQQHCSMFIVRNSLFRFAVFLFSNKYICIYYKYTYVLYSINVAIYISFTNNIFTI